MLFVMARDVLAGSEIVGTAGGPCLGGMSGDPAVRVPERLICVKSPQEEGGA